MTADDPVLGVPAHVQATEKIWACKIGGFTPAGLPWGADLAMRQAVQQAFRQMTGVWPEFTFSGWGGSWSEGQQMVVDAIAPERLRDTPPQGNEKNGTR